ncbi:MAG: class I SAM-dependent methyltransferase [Planctomycetota bacterium]
MEAFYAIWHWVGVYYWVLLVAAVLFAIVFMSVYKFERRYIRQFKPADETKLPTPNFYTREMNNKAGKLGFQNCSWFAQDRGKLYHCTVTMYVSPDNLTLLLVGGGKLVGIDYKTTLLCSKPVEGAVLVTSDQIGEVDSTGFFDKEFLLNANLEELWELHKSRVAFFEGKVEKFDRSDVLAEFEELSRRHVHVLTEHGLARWLDKKKEQWRHTVKGSLQSYICFRRESRKVKKQRKRFLRRAPGERIGGFRSTGIFARVHEFLMPPSEIIEDVGVKLGDVVLDFGCGDWSCSIAVAKAVGAEGKVYALDVHPDACEEVMKRGKKKGLRNIETIESDCMTGLSDECIDIVFFHEILHALGDKQEKVLKELYRVLKINGVLSFSEHGMKEKEIMASVMRGGLFKLLKKGEDLYRFMKVTGGE